jgi:hypothetical protein
MVVAIYSIILVIKEPDAFIEIDGLVEVVEVLS